MAVVVATLFVCDAVPRNYDASLHPLEASREYVRALNSVKLERVFAKPFLGSLDGHRDGISCLGKHPRHLSIMLSGACDGEVNISPCCGDIKADCCSAPCDSSAMRIAACSIS